MEAGGVLTIGGVEGHMVRTDLAGRHIQQSPDPHALATHSGILDRYVTHLVTSRKFGERVEIKDERLDDRAFDPQKSRPQRGWFGDGLDQGAHRLVDRRRNTQFPPSPDEIAVEEVDLRAPAGFPVVIHRSVNVADSSDHWTTLSTTSGSSSTPSAWATATASLTSS